MAPWWLRTHVDEQLEDSDEVSDDGPSIASPNAGSSDDDAATGDRQTGDQETASRGRVAHRREAADPQESDGDTKPRRRRRRRRRRRKSPPGDSKTSASLEPQQGNPETKTDTAAVASSRPSDSEASAGSGSVAPASAAPKSDTVAQEARVSADRSYIFSFPERPPGDERKLALLCDFENIALGVKESQFPKLDINLILARLVEKGKIIVKKAYADWERYSEFKRPLHEAAIELIDIPQKYYSGKNSADIKLVVDAMDLCYSKEHLDTFVILSGDSDFSPLVSKLKENDKVVIGIGVKNSSSNLLVENCDEFIFYEDIWRAAEKRPTLDHLPTSKAEVFGLMVDAILALLRENKEILWGSLVKQTMQRKRPSFTEEYFGYGSFSELLEDAEHHKIIGLRKDQRSGNYVVTGFVHQ